jgi:hypothetical protein
MKLEYKAEYCCAKQCPAPALAYEGLLFGGD